MKNRHKETKVVDYCKMSTFLSDVRVKEEYKNGGLSYLRIVYINLRLCLLRDAGLNGYA